MTTLDPEVRAIAAENLRNREAMRADLAERMRAAEARGGLRPSGATLGERVRNSAAYEAWREQASRGGRPAVNLELGDVLSERELISAIRTRATVDLSTGSGLVDEDASARLVSVAPKPSRIPGLIRVIPADDMKVHATETANYSGMAGGVPESAALPELTNLSLTDESVVLGPFGVAGEVSRGHWRDRGSVAEVTERVFRRDYLRQIEANVLAGDGTETATQKNFLGITQDPAVPTSVYATGSKLDFAAGAMEDVQTAGYDDGSITLAAHPTTLRTIFGENVSAHVREVLYAVDRYVPSVALPVGTVVVGDFYEGTALWVHGGLELAATDSHNSNFLAGIITLRLMSQLAYRTVNPGAFSVVTGL